ncbi:hypothetical protein pneo_cds_1043 [Pandoravirus neocaledonia]|uniref:Uncharacterized protein n=1 Tax=Pandoravirus neocaledonia TaxID=2107708 RepID=A0A2U7UEA8_9VIRU|nr:hypothetical protein pneo_cds_1043 [Pandoravirus neocaledonia]AVK76650.1 hypothetical protein pneo_cds_1043 [Pandoravirus neocaledonia]
MDAYHQIKRDQSWLERRMSKLFSSLLKRLLDAQVKELKLVCSAHEQCVWRLVLGPLALVGKHASRTASLIEDSHDSFTVRGTLDDGRMYHLTVQEEHGKLGADLAVIQHGKATYQKICNFDAIKRIHKRKMD